MRNLLVLFWILTLFMACSAKPLGEVPFDPQNEAHLAEIYVRTVFYKDFAAFERYGVTGNLALEYTRAISQRANDSKGWPEFLKRAEKIREKLKKQYIEEAS